MKLFDRFKKLRLGQKTMIIIAILIVGIGGWITYDNIRPRPLGDEMVYLAKRDYGGGLFYSDYSPTSVYYYETDMDEIAMKDYFNATYSPLEALESKHARFTSPDGSFRFTYEDDSGFKKKRKYVVSIGDEQYEVARKYLKKEK